MQVQETKVSDKAIASAVRTCSIRIEKFRIIELGEIDQTLVITKGKFDVGYEYPFWAMLLKMESIFIVKEFEELLQILLIDGQYYFVAYLEKEESCGRLLILYKLEEGCLMEVHKEYPH
ncbi:MAG: hypothetical protein KKF78_03475 [Candidatus Omnitrophica bacterium]|nr:hypothetical protein [Candidatus Omnitrophota bacterium]MBU1996199.1 hypothetical protein [Candidatus Omnitrophota bacterium]